MRVLLINPMAKFNYKAPYTPLGLLSIATVLKANGHTVFFLNRCFEKANISRVVKQFSPDICGISLVSSRGVSDGVAISGTIKQLGVPIVWGGAVPSSDYEIALRSGLCDYVCIGEGEFTWLELLDAIKAHRDMCEVKGLAFIGEDGRIIKTEDRPLADLADLPVIDWSFDNPEHYMHNYLCCKKMIYLYTSKGCLSRCTFCSNPSFHQFTYRKRPTEKVLEEISFLIKNYHLDGVYFSDECWRIKKEDVYEFCEKIKSSGLSFYWGCEARIGLLGPDELRLMYDCGCRWLFFGIESGSPEMLQCVKKGITVEQIRKTITACNGIGIISIISVIIGFPDETPAQLQETIDLVKELNAGVNAINIFTPVSHTKIYDQLVQEGKYAPPQNFLSFEKYILAEKSDYQCNTIPGTDLKVIRCHFLWESFTQKQASPQGKGNNFSIAKSSIATAIQNIVRLGISGLLPGLALSAKEFLHVFWYAHFYPGIRKKYHL